MFSLSRSFTSRWGRRSWGQVREEVPTASLVPCAHVRVDSLFLSCDSWLLAALQTAPRVCRVLCAWRVMVSPWAVAASSGSSILHRDAPSLWTDGAWEQREGTSGRLSPALQPQAGNLAGPLQDQVWRLRPTARIPICDELYSSCK